MNVETGLMQYTKSDGILHVRSVSDLRIVEAKVNEISIPYNFSRIGSERRKARDLRIRVEYFDKSVKLLNTTAELPKTYIGFFNSALAVELHKNEKTPSGTPTSIVTNNDFGDRQASVEAILNISAD
ncbi:7299_t:CDS:2, partial [Rhizophagus irregularis]